MWVSENSKALLAVALVSCALLALGFVGESQTAPYPCEEDLIEVMFAHDSKVRLRDDRLVDLATDALSGVDAVLSRIGPHEWKRISDVPESRLDEIQARGEARIGGPVYNLNNIYRLRIPGGRDVWSIAADLERLNGVHLARPVPLPVPSPTPPDYTGSQGYERPASASPTGIDADYSWTVPGGDGTGVTVCDLEYSWNYSHADVTKALGSQINSDVADPFSDTNHGTAVIGQLVADPNGFGVTGICNGASLLTCGTYYGAGTPSWNVPGALAVAIANLNPGDVILLEQQWWYDGAGGTDFVPIEWWTDTYPNPQTANAVWVAIYNAIANGIHVVEAGGNGYYDTDTMQWFTGYPYYNTSGGVIVGAGGAYAGGTWSGGDLERLAFSSYGSRFDLQGWGEDVVTTGYGDLYSAEGVNRYYTSTFSGTSSASPIVAAAIANCVGRWTALGHPAAALGPRVLRSFLVTSGTPQVMPPSGSIGPRPDLLRALPMLAINWVDIASGGLADNTGYSVGMAWGDYDDDDDPDLLLCNGGSSNRLFRNDAGTLAEVTSGAIGSAGGTSHASWGDTDNDGDLDVYLANNGAPNTNMLLRNDGGDTFTDVTGAPLDDPTYSGNGAWADYDLDGDIDLFVAGGSWLYRNDGSNAFTDVTPAAFQNAGGSQCGAWADFDLDGDPDLCVGRAGPNALFRNDGGGSFTDITAAPIDDPENTKSVTWGDYDNDGDPDLYYANDVYPNSNKLLRNNGDGSFTDVTVPPIDDVQNGQPWGGISVAWGDVDLDGLIDIYLSNISGRNKLYRNEGGDSWVDATNGTIGAIDVAGGAGFGDLDADGDLDLYVTGVYVANQLQRNDNRSGNNWLRVKLVGSTANRAGIGARIRIVAGGSAQTREISGGTSHQQNELVATFGLGSATSVDSLQVFWPGGSGQDTSNVAANQMLVFQQAGVVTVADGSSAVAGARLLAGLPNPFTASTSIRYELPAATPARLEVFDTQGRRVRLLVEDQLQGPGSFKVTWDGRNDASQIVAPGVYVYRLRAGAFDDTRKILRLR
jgi:hypothetical protein